MSSVNNNNLQAQLKTTVKTTIAKKTETKTVEAETKISQQQMQQNAVDKFMKGGSIEDFRKEAKAAGLTDDQIKIYENQSEVQKALKSLLADKSLSSDIKKALQTFMDSQKGLDDMKALLDAIAKTGSLSKAEEQSASKMSGYLAQMKGCIAKGDEDALQSIVDNFRDEFGDDNGNNSPNTKDKAPGPGSTVGHVVEHVVFHLVLGKAGGFLAGFLLSPADACGGYGGACLSNNNRPRVTYGGCSTHTTCRPNDGPFVSCSPSYVGECKTDNGKPGSILPGTIIYGQCISGTQQTT